ncbi:uncharacterized protein RJT20DRAFT_28839 [Scheffersomyces xylosifermentans]|uniref:uncharacterized protein n=1 Tax=Scheffersomyces xylosifermentans TaxID=1304137 RepID=UPI00315DB705
MRSFIKSHRRNESSTDSGEFPPPPSSSQPYNKTTPAPSPNIRPSAQFTPPSAVPANSASSASSISSPKKKILTPIKNLFSSSHHSRSTITTPTSSDSLNNALYSGPSYKAEPKPPRPSRHVSPGASNHIRSRASISNISELHEISSRGSNNSFTQFNSTTPHASPQRFGNNNNNSLDSDLRAQPVHSLNNDDSNFSHGSTYHLRTGPAFKSSNSVPSLVAYKQINSITKNSQSHTSLSSFHSNSSQLKQSSSNPHINTALSNPLSFVNHSNYQLKGGLKASANITEGPHSLVEEHPLNDSESSLDVSEAHFETKQVSFDASPLKKRNLATILVDGTIDTNYQNDHIKDEKNVSSNTGAAEEEVGSSTPINGATGPFNNSDSESASSSDDNDDELSDTSSQFSFIKDRKGGRNTSVKYYKTIKSPQEEEIAQSNTFNENDLEYEIDEFSDYDFDNNGMEDDYDYNDPETADDVQYNKLFDEDDDKEVLKFNYEDEEDDGKANDRSTFDEKEVFSNHNGEGSFSNSIGEVDMSYDKTLMADQLSNEESIPVESVNLLGEDDALEFLSNLGEDEVDGEDESLYDKALQEGFGDELASGETDYEDSDDGGVNVGSLNSMSGYGSDAIYSNEDYDDQNVDNNDYYNEIGSPDEDSGSSFNFEPKQEHEDSEHRSNILSPPILKSGVTFEHDKEEDNYRDIAYRALERIDEGRPIDRRARGDMQFQLRSKFQYQNRNPYYGSYHLSIQGPESDEEIRSREDILGSSQDTDLENDILENYLDGSKSPQSETNNPSIEFPASFRASNGDKFVIKKTPDLSSLDNLELFDLSSPIINGLTIGHNLRHRLPISSGQHSGNAAQNTNKLFIHRYMVTDSTSSFQWNDFTRLSQLPESDVLRLRSLRSFHGSLDDSLNSKIQEKVEEMDSFSSNHPHNVGSEENKSEVGSLPSNLGLGIGFEEPKFSTLENSTTISNSNKKQYSPARSSIHEVMNILDSLETELENDSTVSLANIDKSESDEKQRRRSSESKQKRRSSILGMMNLLADLESQTVDNTEKADPVVSERKDANENRKSIIEMMSTLLTLESMNTKDTQTLKNRDSISNMMNTLAKLDLSNSESAKEEGKSKSKQRPEVVHSKSGNVPSIIIEKPPPKFIAPRRLLSIQDDGKRYSWFNNDETLNFKSKSSPGPDFSESSSVSNSDVYGTPEEELLPDDYNPALEQALIDEINQLPEDYDFQDEVRSKASPVRDVGFFRSNSYNKKPIKAIMDNKFQSNKIETLNKTVTFYRSNSSGPPTDTSRSRSISRAPSTRSINSFTSVNEEELLEEEAEEEEESEPFRNTFNSHHQFSFKHSSNAKSNESFPKATNNLSTITEADSPYLR